MKSIQPIQLPLPFVLKRCCTCHKAKPLAEFHTDNSQRDGHTKRCKPCRAIEKQEYRARHKEEIAVAGAIYKRAHRAEGAAWMRAYRAKHIEHVRALQGIYNRTSRRQEWRRAYQRRWAIEHPDKAREKNRRSYLGNKELYYASNRRRKARLLGCEGNYSKEEWQALKAQYGNHCLCCGKSGSEIKLTPDHVVPLSKGGTGYISNIQPLCLSCNCRKKDRTIDYRPAS